MYRLSGYYFNDCGKGPFNLTFNDINAAMEEFDKKQYSIDIEYVQLSDSQGILAEYGE